jgi:hypothetical protein
MPGRKKITVRDNTYVSNGKGGMVKAPWMAGDIDVTKTIQTPRKTKTVRDYSYTDAGVKKTFRDVTVVKKGKTVKQKTISRS